MASSSKTTETNSPPDWSKAGYEQAGQVAQDLYNSGSGGNVYTGSTVADLSGATTSGIDNLYNAGGNTNTAGTSGLFSQLGALALDNPYLSENAYLEQSLQPQLDKTANQIRSLYSGMGRGNSDVELSTLTNEIGNLRTSALADDWNRRAQLLSTGINQAQTAATSLAGLDQQQFENALTGANAQIQAGQLIDTQNQANLDDYVNLWTATDNAPWNRLAMYENALAGASADYGTRTSKTKSSNPMAALGAVGSLAGK